jgi:hypothetical protein
MTLFPPNCCRRQFFHHCTSLMSVKSFLRRTRYTIHLIHLHEGKTHKTIKRSVCVFMSLLFFCDLRLSFLWMKIFCLWNEREKGIMKTSRDSVFRRLLYSPKVVSREKQSKNTGKSFMLWKIREKGNLSCFRLEMLRRSAHNSPQHSDNLNRLARPGR